MQKSLRSKGDVKRRKAINGMGGNIPGENSLGGYFPAVGGNFHGRV